MNQLLPENVSKCAGRIAHGAMTLTVIWCMVSTFTL